MEKDERFWVATTLMHLFHAPNRVTLLAETLRHCLGDTPPDSLSSWEAALGQDQFLYFEASLDLGALGGTRTQGHQRRGAE